MTYQGIKTTAILAALNNLKNQNNGQKIPSPPGHLQVVHAGYLPRRPGQASLPRAHIPIQHGPIHRQRGLRAGKAVLAIRPRRTLQNRLLAALSGIADSPGREEGGRIQQSPVDDGGKWPDGNCQSAMSEYRSQAVRDSVGSSGSPVWYAQCISINAINLTKNSQETLVHTCLRSPGLERRREQPCPNRVYRVGKVKRTPTI